MPQSAPKTNSGPTLEVTEGWLAEKIAGYGHFEYRKFTYRQKYEQHASFNNCKMELTYQNPFESSPDHWLQDGVNRSVVDLADLDPNTYQVKPSIQTDENAAFDIWLWTVGKRKKVVNHYGDGSSGSFESFTIVITDGPMAQRMKAAMQHAIQICQELASRQTAAQPATKEPF